MYNAWLTFQKLFDQMHNQTIDTDQSGYHMQLLGNHTIAVH
jgi:hypothetical protein